MRVLQPFCRARLTAADFAFIRTVLLPEMTEQAAFNRLFSDEQMLDVLLDDPRLYRELLESVEHVEVSLPLYFYVTTRNVLTTSGIDDREVADYLASLLVTSAENRLAPGGARGQRQGFYAVDMMAGIQAAPPAQAFALTLSLANQDLSRQKCRRFARGEVGLGAHALVVLDTGDDLEPLLLDRRVNGGDLHATY